MRLHGDIQRAGGFIKHDNIGIGRERPGDGDALALPAGEGVRKPVEIFRANAHLQRQILRQLTAHALAAAFLHPHRLGDDAPDRQSRVERRERILKHHLHAARVVRPLARAGAGLKHAHQQLGQRAFPAAGFPDNAQRFPPTDLKIEPVEGMDLFRYAPQPVFARRKVHVHAIQFQQYIRHGVSPVVDTSRRPVGLLRHWAVSAAFRCISPQRQSSARGRRNPAEAG